MCCSTCTPVNLMSTHTHRFTLHTHSQPDDVFNLHPGQHDVNTHTPGYIHYTHTVNLMIVCSTPTAVLS